MTGTADSQELEGVGVGACTTGTAPTGRRVVVVDKLVEVDEMAIASVLVVSGVFGGNGGISAAGGTIVGLPGNYVVNKENNVVNKDNKRINQGEITYQLFRRQYNRL